MLFPLSLPLSFAARPRLNPTLRREEEEGGSVAGARLSFVHPSFWGGGREGGKKRSEAGNAGCSVSNSLFFFFRFCGEKEKRKRRRRRKLSSPLPAWKCPNAPVCPFFYPVPLERSLSRLPAALGRRRRHCLPPSPSLSRLRSFRADAPSVSSRVPPVLLRAFFCRHRTKHSNEWAAERESVFQGPFPPLLIKPIGR